MLAGGGARPSIDDVREAVVSGRRSAVDTALETLRSISSIERETNSFITVAAEQGLLRVGMRCGGVLRVGMPALWFAMGLLGCVALRGLGP